MPQECAAPSCSGKNNAARSGGGRRILEKGLKSVSDARPTDGTLRSLNLVKRRPYVAGIWREYAARLADELYTSDIEEVDIVDERGNPLLYINARPTCW